MICMTPACTIWCTNWGICGLVAGLTGLIPSRLPWSHFLYTICALSFRLPCFSSSDFSQIYISQGCAATRFGCGEIFDDFFYPNFSKECDSEGIMKIRWELTELRTWAGVLLFVGTRCIYRVARNKRIVDLIEIFFQKTTWRLLWRVALKKDW